MLCKMGASVVLVAAWVFRRGFRNFCLGDAFIHECQVFALAAFALVLFWFISGFVFSMIRCVFRVIFSNVA